MADNLNKCDFIIVAVVLESEYLILEVMPLF
jgi:hypothetical protein